MSNVSDTTPFDDRVYPALNLYDDEGAEIRVPNLPGGQIRPRKLQFIGLAAAYDLSSGFIKITSASIPQSRKLLAPGVGRCTLRALTVCAMIRSG